MKRREIIRTVTAAGTILLENRVLRVPSEWAGSRVRVFTNSLGAVEVKHADCRVTVIPFDQGLNRRSTPV